VQSPGEINVMIVLHSIRHIENRVSLYLIFCFCFKRSLGFDERRLSIVSDTLVLLGQTLERLSVAWLSANYD